MSLCVSVSQTALDQGPLKNLKMYIPNYNLIRCQSGKKKPRCLNEKKGDTLVERSLQTGEF